MSASVCDLSSKMAALKERRDDLVAMDKVVETLVRLHAPDEAMASTSCFPRLLTCTNMFMRRVPVATSEPTAAKQSAAQANPVLMRMVGVRKETQSETQKIDVAMAAVAERVQGLKDRVAIGRKRALAERKAGKNEEALRVLKKSKAVEKQLAVAQAALDTLERQQDLIAESALQRELATALNSTTRSVKSKGKGLLTLAEKAIDESVEAADDVQDVAAVFETLAPTFDGDDDKLLEELKAMLDDDPPPTSVVLEAAAVETDTVHAAVFPSAPKKQPVRVEERQSLLSAGV